MLLIIGAMKEELQFLLNNDNVIEQKDTLFPEYLIKEKNTVIVISGVGLVNAASCLTNTLNRYPITKIFNIGTSASIEPSIDQGEICFVKNSYYSCVDLTAFGYDYGQLPKLPLYFSSDIKLLEKFQDVLDMKQNKLLNIASSDIFLNSSEKVNNSIGNIPSKISIADMECASFMQVAHKFEIPFVSIKIISDIVGVKARPNTLQFKDFLVEASMEIEKMCKKIINSI